MNELESLIGKEDFRYCITVYLIREPRPKYWEFYCSYCTQKVCELDGRLIMMRDVTYNTAAVNYSSVRVRCPGTDKKWCRMWYEFELA